MSKSWELMRIFVSSLVIRFDKPNDKYVNMMYAFCCKSSQLNHVLSVFLKGL